MSDGQHIEYLLSGDATRENLDAASLKLRISRGVSSKYRREDAGVFHPILSQLLYDKSITSSRNAYSIFGNLCTHISLFL